MSATNMYLLLFNLSECVELKLIQDVKWQSSELLVF